MGVSKRELEMKLVLHLEREDLEGMASFLGMEDADAQLRRCAIWLRRLCVVLQHGLEP
jgi:hypothetical protein